MEFNYSLAGFLFSRFLLVGPFSFTNKKILHLLELFFWFFFLLFFIYLPRFLFISLPSFFFRDRMISLSQSLFFPELCSTKWSWKPNVVNDKIVWCWHLWTSTNTTERLAWETSKRRTCSLCSQRIPIGGHCF
jgi:hypothetical protein